MMSVENASQTEDRLFWAVRFMQGAVKHLEDVEQIGRWMKSDDCSDNRNRRQGLTDAASDLFSVRQNLMQVQILHLHQQKQLLLLCSELQPLEEAIRQLADSVLDTMAENQEFTSAVWKLQEAVEKAQSSLALVAASIER